MKGGTGEHSYATNSHYQRNVFYEIQPVVIENVREMLVEVSFPGCIKVADLGCSSGQNTFLAMSEIINTIIQSYQQKEKLKMEVKGRCFVSGVPNSFYSRLFPSKSLHFVHSSFSIHWLSKIPDGLENNTRSIHIKDPSPPNVFKSYLNQFKNDFSLFLKMRSEEMVPNGHMVLTFVGRKVSDPLYQDCFQVWSLLSDCLLDLVSEGVVKESDIESFNMPFYNPNEEDVREVILKEGSFEISKIETFDHIVPYKIKCIKEEKEEDQSLQMEVGKRQASWARCITEPLLVAHFGDAIIEPVFNKYAHYMAKYLCVSNHRPNMTLIIVVSLTRT
ncbi:salicylate/benzoate carboxyl methyltransferase isoform X2 [Eutrema salsugineum]|uniref:salicylate/benzoate carboxyl methyltransferase isoform X2 n=1 Tax=Eutrema salsugineum TaxID=72664 RepID=UPI000CED3F0C|nr:salicylate/benzoate carboxyl methyltransferase isoform X2 [Eutrema salsugineum]